MKEKIIVLKNQKERIRVLNQLKTNGVRVIHDMGSFIIVQDPVSKKVKGNLTLEKISLAETKSLSTMKGLKPEEELLAKAFLLRKSTKFRKLKDKQVSGQSPEEKMMFEAGCAGE